MWVQAYDSHCNLVLGDVEETIYAMDEDEDDGDVKVCAFEWSSNETDANVCC